MSFPASGYLSDNARDEGEMKTAFEDWLEQTKQIPGAGTTEQVLTIAAGLVTPAASGGGIIDLRGQGGADDILDKVVTTNLARGQMLWLFAGNPGAEDITVNHAAGGNDQIVLSDGVDFIMNATGMYLVLRYDGTDWEEMDRSWGDQSPNTAAFRTHFGLGTAATLNSGTSAGNVPLVSDILGKQTFFIDSTALVPQTTDGAGAVAQTEITANRPEAIGPTFPTGVTRWAQFRFPLPEGWDASAIEYRVYWTKTGSASGTVQWRISSLSTTDGESMNQVFANNADVTDTAIAQYGGHITAWTALTLENAGSSRLFRLRLGRVGGTLTDDAIPEGIEFRYVINALNDD